LASIGVAFTIAAVVVIAVAVTQTKKNAYPDYSQVAYHLSDTCTQIYQPSLSQSLDYFTNEELFVDEGEGFFDQFNYFTGSDPSNHPLYLS
jgi:hypothetical protein